MIKCNSGLDGHSFPNQTAQKLLGTRVRRTLVWDDKDLFFKSWNCSSRNVIQGRFRLSSVCDRRHGNRFGIQIDRKCSKCNTVGFDNEPVSVNTLQSSKMTDSKFSKNIYGSWWDQEINPWQLIFRLWHIVITVL